MQGQQARLGKGASGKPMSGDGQPSCQAGFTPTWVQQSIHERLAEDGDELAVQVGVLQAVPDVLDGRQAATAGQSRAKT
jgi:hypothetical protein